MTFHEVRFPTAISLGARGGPERRTEIVTLGSGFEERNAVWAHSRRRYDVGYGVKSLADLHAVIAFFEARMGRLYGFRFKDHADYASVPPGAAVTPGDQALGVGDGSTASFQLVKTYASGAGAWTRTIRKPVAGSVRIALDGDEALSGWSADTATGIVTFDTAPDAGVAVTAGFEFDVPVRFDTDLLTLDAEGFAAGGIPNIAIVEIRL